MSKVSVDNARCTAKETSGLPADFFDNNTTPSTSHHKSNHTTVADVKQKVTSITSSNLLGSYDSESSSDDEEAMEVNEVDLNSSTAPVVLPVSTGQLPSDFFDSKVSVVMEPVDTKPQTITEKLPEGFFDDPKMDAKVRQVVFKDKMEEEWELYQRQMKEESMISETLVEQDDERRDAERSIEEIDDHMNRLSRVVSLLKKKDLVMTIGANDTQDNEQNNKKETGSDIDEDELNEILDWRCKKV